MPNTCQIQCLPSTWCPPSGSLFHPVGRSPPFTRAQLGIWGACFFSLFSKKEMKASLPTNSSKAA